MSKLPKLLLDQIHPNIIRQVFFLTVIVIIGLLLFSELYFMMSAFLGAVTLYVILMEWMKKLIFKYKWKPWIAATLLMLLSLVIMVIPIAYLGAIAVDKIMPVVQNPEVVNQSARVVNNYLIENFSIDILKAENVEKIGNEIFPFAQKTLGGTFSVLGNIFLMYLILYFMLINTRGVERWLRRNIPFKTNNVVRVISQVRNLVYSNAVGIPIVAIIQGFVGMIGYWIFGAEEFILMGILTAISSVIPLVGTMVVYVPLAIYQFAVGDHWQGIGIAIWGLAIIGSVDNIARFAVQKRLADVHPLITLLGVFIGINMFGFLGIIFGPLLISIFFLLVNVYIDEYGKSERTIP